MTDLRASLMVRLSDAADDSNLSRDGMMADLRALAAQMGARVVAEHVDDGISGSVRDRPGFMTWLDDGVSGRANVLLSWSGDRITREGINAAALVLDVVEGKDPKTGKVVRPPVRFASFDDRLDSEEGDAFRWRFVIAAEVARGERQRAVRRNQARVRRMAAQGRHVGNVPYGYRMDPERPGVLIENKPEADAIRECARRVLAGQPLGQVARWLNAEGPRPRKAPEWTRRALAQILTNEANAGRPLAPGAPAREAILGYATLAEVRRLIRDPRTAGERRKRRSSALLAGLLVCWDCHAPMRSSSSRYVCMTRSDGGERCSGAVSIGRRRAEEAVEAAFLARWGRLARFREETVIVGASERDAIELEIAGVLEEIRTAFTPELGARLAALQTARDELAARPAQTARRRVLTGRTWADEWRAATTEDRRDMLAAVYASITCHPGWADAARRLELEPRDDLAELGVDEHGDVI